MSIETTLTLLLATVLFFLIGLMWLLFRSAVWIYRRFRPVPESQRAHPDTREWPQRAPLGERVGIGARRIGAGLASGLQFVAAYLAAWFVAAGRGARSVILASGRTIRTMSATGDRVLQVASRAASRSLTSAYRTTRQSSVEIGERAFERMHAATLSNPASSFFDPSSIAEETIWRDIATEPLPETEVRRRSARKVMILRGPALTTFFTWLGR